ncbi:MAG: NAD(P)H-hydrate dehydratase [Myxococcales bacterium]|nr:NAD(P)H-hydrate dehydratase [Myxococcales bacterium]
MIPLLSREQARGLDEHAVQELGISTLVLMENAGSQATRLIVQNFSPQLSRVLVTCGTGQNGADGWVCARHLRALGHHPMLWCLGDPETLTGDARVNCQAALKLGLKVTQGLSELERLLGEATLVVDALFGTGLSRPITGDAQRAIRAINEHALSTVALDVPSGIHADTGQICGEAICATMTVTFGGHKRGLCQHPGRAQAGKVHSVSLGVPVTEGSAMLMEERDLGRWLIERASDTHKGREGHVWVVGGSAGKSGAALLAGAGAMRSGAGSVTIASGSEAGAAIDAGVLECMTFRMSDDAHVAVRQIMRARGGMHAAVLGPGFGLEREPQAILHALALKLPVPAVLDADALWAWGEEGLDTLREAVAPRVLTPHPGEAARLLVCTVEEVQADRYGAALELAKQSRQVVILKGAGSIVAAPDGRMRICSRGSPAMATAGSGDVLAGMVAAQVRALKDVFDAASAGTLLHALSAESAAYGDRGLLAHEIAKQAPHVIAQAMERRP